MNDKMITADITSLKKLFQNDKISTSPYIYLPIDSENDLSSPQKIARLISGYKKSGFGGVIPFANKNYKITALTKQYYDFYETVKKETDSNNLILGYLDDTYIMREYLAEIQNTDSAICRILTKYEYECTETLQVKRKLRDTGDLMSVVAVSDDQRIIDLREYVKDGVIEWEVPAGNWTIEEYICECDRESSYIDFLNYDVSSEYIRKTFGFLLDRLYEQGKEKSPIEIFIYRNVMYAGKNRRMWSPEFNKTFEEMYGFDPAPYYPLMFRDFDGYSKRYKCMLMKCRTKMLIEGYVKAAADYCTARGIFCTGFPAESKATACSWLFGDGQMIHKYASAPGLSMPFAYLYGLNGIRVASGAADAFGNDTVSADMFNYYLVLSKDIIYREAMNAFVRGVNMTFAHLGEDRAAENTDIGIGETTPWGSIFSKGDDLGDFASFVTRVQAVLRGGEHISEVAIVYPINSLHSLVYLYQSEFSGFEYPSTPENADYMELMNNFLNYVGTDATFVHPDMITERSFAENGVLYLNNDKNVMKFKILVLPSMSIVSVKTMRMAKRFFDEGGKIIATDNLPAAACECATIFDDVNNALRTESAEDKEVKEIIDYIFGKDATDHSVYKTYYKNENEAGGIAYFLPSNKTSADGTDTVNANILYQAAANFGIAPDIYIDKMPRREFMGIVNYHLPAFLKVGIDKRLAKGCSMNYTHKRYAGCDIYFITNTTGDLYSGNILLRGRHNPEEWNPYTGKIRKLTFELVRFKGEVYTLVNTQIEASSCIFIVSQIQRTQKELIRDLTEEEHLREFFPKENF